MRKTMQAIIDLQRKYFVEGNESDLRPMKLEDISQRTNQDASTVSRVCSSKYAETPWGIIPLKFFFSDAYDTGDGNEVSTRAIKQALKELVDKEEPGKPMSDIKLAAEMEKMGYPIARRTVAKYREQLGIPPSHMRK
jgi:RNA polymerase sigma-54 factor